MNLVVYNYSVSIVYLAKRVLNQPINTHTHNIFYSITARRNAPLRLLSEDYTRRRVESRMHIIGELSILFTGSL